MKIRILILISFLAVSAVATCQTGVDINKTDEQGKKQGIWIKKYPNGNVQYEGTFKDDHPAGEFKRYYDDRTLMSVLIYSDDGRQADATFYHQNGFIASQGKYNDQMKEGKWKFFSQMSKGYLLSEDEYSRNVRNGPSMKYYPDTTVAERHLYKNDLKEGEWTQYHENGKLLLKSYYTGGILNGKFEVWFENGQLQYSGWYRNDLREGKWLIYNVDGSLKYEINYTAGISKDNKMETEAAEYLDFLERTKDKIADPEKTGVIRR